MVEVEAIDLSLGIGQQLVKYGTDLTSCVVLAVS